MLGPNRPILIATTISIRLEVGVGNHEQYVHGRWVGAEGNVEILPVHVGIDLLGHESDEADLAFLHDEAIPVPEPTP